MDARFLQAAAYDACVQDVRAFKPGNVSIAAPGHGMQAEHFISAARAAAAPMCAAGAPVGARIESAIRASWAAVPCNTNLGIVLLLAPVLHAAESACRPLDTAAPLHFGPAAAPLDSTRAAAPLATPSLRDRLRATLRNLTVGDAEHAYRAIRQARPGGLGRQDTHDVHQQPAVTLRAAMQAAAPWDDIAKAYSDDFAAVFEVGVPALAASNAAGEAELWGVTRCYLTLLGHAPDTHIARKSGKAAAMAVQQEGARLMDGWPPGGPAAAHWEAWRAADRRWKAAGINPGTTADLTVASLLVNRLQLAGL